MKIEDVLAANAKRLRGDRTQVEVADAGGLTVSQLSQIENGSPANPPSLKTLVKLATGLGVEVWVLLKPRGAG